MWPFSYLESSFLTAHAGLTKGNEDAGYEGESVARRSGAELVSQVRDWGRVAKVPVCVRSYFKGLCTIIHFLYLSF